MKILISNDTPGCGPYFQKVGFARIFQQMGHAVHMWEPAKKPAFDVFNEFEPDLYIGQTYTTNRAIYKCIKARPEMKVVMQCSTWGPILESIDLEKYPILVPSQTEKDMIARLKNETGKPDFVYLHYFQSDIDTISGWNSLGVATRMLTNGADVFDYLDSAYMKELESDVCFVGGRWPYKSQTLDNIMLRLCNKNTAPIPLYQEHLNVKIWGNQGWNGVPQYLGMLDQDLCKHAFRSAKFCVNVSEPHSTAFGFDPVERPFKCALAGGLVLCDNVKCFKENKFPFIYYNDYYDLCCTIVSAAPAKLDRYIKMNEQYKFVLQHHTYHNRVVDLFEQLGMRDEAEKCRSIHAAIVEKEMHRYEKNTH